MIGFWLRELAGWLLVGVGLFVFYTTFLFCAARLPIEAFLLMIVGIFVFRGGIHLLKVAIAARVAMQAQDRLYPLPGGSNPPRKRSGAGERGA